MFACALLFVKNDESVFVCVYCEMLSHFKI